MSKRGADSGNDDDVRDTAGMLESLREVMPDKWMVRKIEGGHDAAYWIAGNPKRMQGQVFARSEHHLAIEHCNMMAAADKREVDREAELLARHHRRSGGSHT